MPAMVDAALLGTALVLAAWALAPWLVHVMRPTSSRWIRYRAHVVLAGASGAGIALLSVTPLERGVLAAAALAVSLLVVTDLAEHRVPDAFTIPTAALVAAGWCTACLLGAPWPALARALLAAAVTAAALLIWSLLSPTGIGLGDVKLGGLLALVVGWFSWQAVLLAALIGSAFGGVVAALLLIAGRATRHTQLPAGPWLSAGAVVALATIA